MAGRPSLADNSFEAMYGDQPYDSIEVLTDLKKKAMAVVARSLQGYKVPYGATDLAKFVLAKTHWIEAEQKPVNVTINFQMIEDAKRRAGLLPAVVKAVASESK